MNEMETKRHNFGVAINRIKDFSEKTEKDFKIEAIGNKRSFFGLREHRVTASELDGRLKNIQKLFIDINTTNNKTIKEFKEVYTALDVLDKDYITSIVASVKAIEKTSNDVRIQQGTLKKYNKKLNSQQNKLDYHQNEIKKNIANVTKIVKILKSFKEELESYKHLTDIDKIWSDCKIIRNETQEVSDSITMLSKKTTNDIANTNLKNKALVEQINGNIFALQEEAESFKTFFSKLAKKIEDTARGLDEQIPNIQHSLEFVNHMSDITHLNDIDSIWGNVSDARKSIKGINNELYNFNNSILQVQNQFEQLDAFVVVLKNYAHLQDIDSMWSDLDNNKIEIKEIYKNINDSDEINRRQQGDLKRLNAESVEYRRISDALSQNQNETRKYSKYNRELIEDLQEFRREIDSLEHLIDVDSIWNQGNFLKKGLSGVNNSINSLQQKTVEIDNEIEDRNEKFQDSISSLEKKLKYTYFIAGGALGFAALELLLAVIGVI